MTEESNLEKDILYLWNQEYATYREIEGEFNVGQDFITDVLEKNGIIDRKSANIRRLHALGPQIAQKYEEGYSLNDLMQEYSTSYNTLKDILKDNDIERFRDKSESHHAKNGLKIDLTMNENLGYIVGVLEGDGSVYKAKRGEGNTWCIALHVKSKKFAQSFYESLQKIGLTPTFCPKKCSRNSKQYWYVLTSNRKCYQWYQDFNYHSIAQEPKSVQMGFIRGFYESEGSYNPNGSNLIVGCGKDRSLVKFVSDIVTKHKFKVNFYKQNQENSGFDYKNTSIMYYIRLLGGTKARDNFIREINPTIKRS